MKLKTFCFVCSIFFAAFLSGAELQTAVARGIGSTSDAALKDALNQAVMQAAGAIVDSQTLLKNDEIIQEKVLTASNAIVKKYDIVMPAKQRANGLWEVKIKAVVQQNLLRQTLVKHNLIKGSVEGTQNLWAEIVTEEKNQVDMEAMLENIFSKIDFKKYLRFSLIGVGGTKGNKAKLYIKPLQNDKNKIFVAAGLICVFDSIRFQKECMPHLKKIFDSLPWSQKKEFTNQVDPKRVNFLLPPNGSWSRPRDNILTLQEKRNLRESGYEAVASWRVTPVYGWNGFLFLRKNCGIYEGTRIFLNITPQYRPGNQRFVCYVHEKQNNLFKIIEKKQAELKNFSVSLCFSDQNGNEIKRITKRLGGTFEKLFAGCYQSGSDIIISPEIFKGYGVSHDTSSSQLVILPMSTEIDLEDFKDIKSFKLIIEK